MKNKIINVIKSFAPTVIVVLLIFGIFWFKGIDVLALLFDTEDAKTSHIPDEVVKGKILSSYEDTEDSKVVTVVEIESALRQIGEVTTVAYSYSGSTGQSEPGKALGMEFDFVSNNIMVSYSGTIRAGYVIGDINCEVDNDNHVITVKLPEPQVFSNEINVQNVCWDDNVFNRVDPDIASQLTAEARNSELDEAIDSGLYSAAGESAEKIIRQVLAKLCDYEVVFESEQTYGTHA